jgi:hypothetical protein
MMLSLQAVRLRYLFETFLYMNFPLFSSTFVGKGAKEGKVGLDVSGKYLHNDNNGDKGVDNNEGVCVIGSQDRNGQNRTAKQAGAGEDGSTMTPDRYVFNTKQLYNDFLVNFFPQHVSFWREMT